ncbi:ribosome maturation factor RimM [Acetilactobacillus jinshanensis]|uniref:Ribosome maturation factor RimM n=1 Tax=Acetilactobacillus jinshanensis TaxID=1720083 RepID=A0A4P6ZL93_9LACO|nr:ribosome maturation factor RimM [Acetilactobacillus jinshanensis]QBP18605.1 ribosome maturation factor RimM [Acetilactobacillus jinshanensis]URL61481.1 ribosome maturation factor RimM [uncultured bacterium]
MNYYDVGYVVNTHGIKGELKVASKTDFPKQRFAKGSQVYLKTSLKRIPLTVDGCRTQMDLYLIHFKGYDNINDVLFMKHHLLQIDEKAHQQINLKPDQYFYQQIIGLKVVDVQGHPIGTVSNIMKTGANDVWVVSRPGKHELLLPKIKQVIKKVDFSHHQVIVQLMEGM